MNKSSLNRLTEIAKLFLKLGIIGFGGPVAHIAMIEDEVVKRRQWLTQEHFLDLLGVTNLIHGPNSTEMAIHIGYIYAGWLGLIIAGVCFILPAVLITGLFAWLYVNYGTLPQVLPLLYGIKPVVLAIIINAIWGLGKKAVKTRKLLIISIVVGLITWFAKVNEVVANYFDHFVCFGLRAKVDWGLLSTVFTNWVLQAPIFAVLLVIPIDRSRRALGSYTGCKNTSCYKTL